MIISPSHTLEQVNEKGHIGIVEKAQETSNMHNTVCLCHHVAIYIYFMNSGCVLECRETPTSQVTI